MSAAVQGRSSTVKEPRYPKERSEELVGHVDLDAKARGLSSHHSLTLATPEKIRGKRNATGPS
jgi:hypothetical protein